MEAAPHLYKFGSFCLNAEERVLLCDGRLVPLPAKALSTLIVLVRHQGHVLEKDFLMSEVWPDEDVEEGNLAQQIFMLRKALYEDTAGPKYIETIPRRGYRFVAVVSVGLPPGSARYEGRQSATPYTENSDAHQAYLEGLYCWSKHSREGLAKAIACFRRAIELDPDYALGYAGIVDCYLRLATNYILPTEASPAAGDGICDLERDGLPAQIQASIKTRCEWDLRLTEKERKRAVGMKTNYPSAHQWYGAYRFSRTLFRQAVGVVDAQILASDVSDESSLKFDAKLESRIQLSEPTIAEQVQIHCLVARQQIDVGNYKAGCLVLQPWWTFGEWPRLERLGADSSADLLLTAGALAGDMAIGGQVSTGEKHAEALLNGAISLFGQLGARTQAAEARMELAWCYYRDSALELARSTFLAGLRDLSDDDHEFRIKGLVRLAEVERQAGRLHDAVARLTEAGEILERLGSSATGRHRQVFASTLVTLGGAEGSDDHFQRALDEYKKSLLDLGAVGDYRHTAVAEGNCGYLLLTLKRLDEAETRLLNARTLFDSLNDKFRRAQVNDTLARLYVAAGRFDLAEQAIVQAVDTLKARDYEAFLAEALTTQGVVLGKLGHYRKAKRVLYLAHRVAERCGDSEGAGQALLALIEEMLEQLDEDERLELVARLDRVLAHSQNVSTRERLRRSLELVTHGPASFTAQRAQRSLA